MVRIPKTILDEMVAHARSDAPNECCGLLAGRGDAAEKRYPMTNIQNSPVSYMIDPKEQFAAFKEIRTLDIKLIAIYHSHPETEAYPSATDVRLAYYPESVYIIISLKNPDEPSVKAFRILDGTIQPEEMEILAS